MRIGPLFLFQASKTLKLTPTKNKTLSMATSAKQKSNVNILF